MTREHSLRVKLLAVAISTLITTVVLFGVGELVTRHRERNRSTVPGSMSMIFYRHERLGHALIRDNDYFGWIHVNAQGVRGTRPVAVPKPAGTFRILADGGSTTFDSFVSADDRTWPARLEAWLNELAPGSQVEVVNVGVPGYRVQQNLIQMLGEQSDWEPDLVLQLQGHNDLFSALLTARCKEVRGGSTPGEVRRITPWRYWLERNSLLFNKLVGKWNAVRPRLRARGSSGAQSPPDFDARVACGEERFQRDLAAYLAVVRLMNVPIVLLEPMHISGAAPDATTEDAAAWRNAVPGVPPEHVLKGYERFASILNAEAHRAGAIYLELGDAGLAGRQWYYDGDPIHFNDAGADRMAQYVARSLVDSGLVRGAVPATRQGEDTLTGTGAGGR